MTTIWRVLRSNRNAHRHVYNIRSCLHNDTASDLNNPQRNITSMDLLEERMKQRTELREESIGGQNVRWNYRSEIVEGLQLDRSHRNIWLSFSVIIVFGFTAFVKLKSDVVASRKAEMAERERLRKELHLTGESRKSVGLVN